MNAKRWLLLLALGISIFTQASAPAGGKYCPEHPEVAICPTPTATSQAVETEEPPSKESTPTDTPSDTPMPSETPVTPAPTEAATATETPGENPATPTPTQTENPRASCEVNLVQALDNGWVEITVSYVGGENDSTWWYFTANGASYAWTDEWFGTSGQTRVFGDLFNPGESFRIDVFVNGGGPVCSRSISVPNPAPPEPTPTQEPTQQPQDAVCTFAASSNNEVGLRHPSLTSLVRKAQASGG